MSPRPRGGKKGKDLSVEELSSTLQEVEKSWQQEVRQRNEEEKKHKRELVAAKKLITREVRSASGAVRKKEMEAKRMEQRITHVDKQKEQVGQTKARQVERYDQKLGQCENRRNDFEDTLHTKMADLGEAKGRLAHVKFAEQMLAKGMIVSIDGAMNGNAVDNMMEGDRPQHSFGESTEQDVAYLAAENERLVCQNQELMQRLESAERSLQELRGPAGRNANGNMVRQLSSSQVRAMPNTPVQFSRGATPYSSTTAGGVLRPSMQQTQPYSPRQGLDSSSQVDTGPLAVQARLGQPSPRQGRPGQPGYQPGYTPRLSTPGGLSSYATPSSESPPLPTRVQTTQPILPGQIASYPRPSSAARLATPPPSSVRMGMPMSALSSAFPVTGFGGGYLPAGATPRSFSHSQNVEDVSVVAPSATSTRSSAPQASVGFASAPPVNFGGVAPLGFQPYDMGVFPGSMPIYGAGGQPVSFAPSMQARQTGGSPPRSIFGVPGAGNVVMEEVTTTVPYGGGMSGVAQTARARGSLGANELFTSMDKNHDGVLSYDEFRSGIKDKVITG